MIGKSYPDLGTGISRRLNIPQPEEICIDDMLHIHRSLETVDVQSVELECTLDNEGTDNENCKYTNYDDYINGCKEARRGDSNLIGTMLKVDFELKCELSTVKYTNYPFCSAKSCENNNLQYRVNATLEELEHNTDCTVYLREVRASGVKASAVQALVVLVSTSVLLW